MDPVGDEERGVAAIPRRGRGGRGGGQQRGVRGRQKVHENHHERIAVDVLHLRGKHTHSMAGLRRAILVSAHQLLIYILSNILAITFSQLHWLIAKVLDSLTRILHNLLCQPHDITCIIMKNEILIAHITSTGINNFMI
jgi:hypothetical protein